jgi:hypothetical protein
LVCQKQTPYTRPDGSIGKNHEKASSLYKASTRQTTMWYLNNNVYAGGANGPTLPAGWSLTAP